LFGLKVTKRLQHQSLCIFINYERSDYIKKNYLIANGFTFAVSLCLMLLVTFNLSDGDTSRTLCFKIISILVLFFNLFFVFITGKKTLKMPKDIFQKKFDNITCKILVQLILVIAVCPVIFLC